MITHYDIMAVPANWDKLPLDRGIYVVDVVDQHGFAVPLGGSSWITHTPDGQSLVYPRGASSIVNIGVSKSLRSRTGNKINELADELKDYKHILSSQYRLRLRAFSGYEETDDLVVEKIVQVVFAMVFGSLPLANGIEGSREDESKRNRRLAAFQGSAKSVNLSTVGNWQVLRELVRTVLEPSLTSPLYGVACDDVRSHVRVAVQRIFTLLEFFASSFSQENAKMLFDEAKRRIGTPSEGKTPSELLLLLDNTSDYIVQVRGISLTIGGSSDVAVEPALSQRVAGVEELVKSINLKWEGATIGTNASLDLRPAYA